MVVPTFRKRLFVCGVAFDTLSAIVDAFLFQWALFFFSESGKEYFFQMAFSLADVLRDNSLAHWLSVYWPIILLFLSTAVVSLVLLFQTEASVKEKIVGLVGLLLSFVPTLLFVFYVGAALF